MRDNDHLRLRPDDDEDGGGPQDVRGRPEAVHHQHHRQDWLQLLHRRAATLQSTPAWTRRKINYSCQDSGMTL